jgi:uroporphyrinogen decarboxylase
MNHRQRIEAAMRGDPADHPPIEMWRHIPEDDLDTAKLAQRTLDWQNRFDFDLIKFMCCNAYGVHDWGVETVYRGAPHGARETVKPAVQKTADWARIGDLDVRRGSYGQQNEALREVANTLKGTVPILQRGFSPLSTARKLATDAFMAVLRRAPEALERALRVITDVSIRFALDAIEAGADGIFMATQFASYRLMTAEEYERFGKRYEVELLEALAGKARINMLHAHGQDIMFDMLAEYPIEMFNWHDRLTEPTLAEAGGRYRGVRVGGIAETGALIRADLPAIEREVRDAIAQTDGRRLLIGPGCVVPITVKDEAVEAATRAARAGA